MVDGRAPQAMPVDRRSQAMPAGRRLRAMRQKWRGGRASSSWRTDWAWATSSSAVSCPSLPNAGHVLPLSHASLLLFCCLSSSAFPIPSPAFPTPPTATMISSALQRCMPPPPPHLLPLLPRRRGGSGEGRKEGSNRQALRAPQRKQRRRTGRRNGRGRGGKCYILLPLLVILPSLRGGGAGEALAAALGMSCPRCPCSRHGV